MLPVLRFFGRKLDFRKCLEILKKKISFLILKGNEIVSSLQKIIQMGQNGAKVIVLQSLKIRKFLRLFNFFLKVVKFLSFFNFEVR